MIKQLQSLRFFAISMVFLSHLLFLQNTTYRGIFNRYFYDGGAFGVEFFLILSGFVIAYNYMGKFGKLNCLGQVYSYHRPGI
jgi:peptidoglycan/LPS O-acetylase OafA/YrhL